MKDLTRGNISRNLWRFAIPSLISGLFSYALSTIDRVMMGKIVGDIGLAAVGATGSYFEILWGLKGALGFAFGSWFTYLVGSGDGGAIKRAYKVNMRVSILIGLVIAAGSILLWRPMFAFLNVPADVFEEAKRYYIVYAATFPLFIVSGNLGGAMHAFGNSVFPMCVGFVGALSNVVLNYIMIVPLKMGAMGAAVATLLVSAGGCLANAIKLRGELAGLKGECGHVPLSEYRPILKLLGPTALQQMVMHLLAFAIQPSINTLGKTAIAALAVGGSVFGLIALAYQKLSSGLAVLVGQSMGQKKPSIARRGLWITARQILLLTVPVILVLVACPRIAPLVFLEDPYGETASILISYIYCCIPFSISVALNSMLHNFFRGVLRPGVNIAGGIAMGVTRAVLSITLIPVIGVYGAFIGYSAGWTADLLVMLGIYLSKKWKTKDYKKAERAEREAQLQDVTE